MEIHTVDDCMLYDRWVVAQIYERDNGDFLSMVSVLPLDRSDTAESGRIKLSRSLSDAQTYARRLFDGERARRRKSLVNRLRTPHSASVRLFKSRGHSPLIARSKL
jgi:hypothetical protein